MKAVFADTYFYLALLNRRDAAHARVVRVMRELAAPVVTTAWVMAEVADAMASPMHRVGFSRFFDALGQDPNVTTIPASDELFLRGMRLYAERPDKERSLTDCISFTVMQDEGLSDVLTADHHFEQAGFRPLLA